MGAQYDPASVWMLTNGSATTGVATLDSSLLSPFDGNEPPATAADLTKFFAISQTGIVTWVVNNHPYAEPTTPILFGNISDGWQANTTLHMPFNSTIDIVMTVSNDSMDTVSYPNRLCNSSKAELTLQPRKMGHPMHLHGHKFWILGSGNGSFPYHSIADAPQSLINLQNPPYRDTTDLPVSGWVAIR